MSVLRSLALLSSIPVLLACAEPGPVAPGDVAAPSASDEGGGKADAARTRQCLSAFSPASPAGWRHFGSRLIAGLGWPVHSASDVIVRPGATAPVRAKFAYGGALSKDLEDEWIWVFINDCSAWRYVGYARTNDDGRMSFDLPGSLPAGIYDVRLEVVGDATTAALRLFVLPAGTHFAVFDIDGTLTEDDGELWEELLLGRTPEAYPAAVDVTWAEATRDEAIIYLTGRPEILAGQTRAWLRSQGFPPGAVKLAPRAGDVLPTNGGVGSYKAAYLTDLTGRGYRLDDAFGNATTDIYAYARAGLSLARTWIVGSHAGEGGTRAVHGSWQDVADQLFAEPPVTQP